MKSKQEIVKHNIEEYAFLMELKYLVDIANNLSFTEFTEIVCQFLQSEDRRLVSDTCFAIRDLIVCGHRCVELEQYKIKYSESLIVKTLENLLFSADRNNVKDAIYTLGKTCSYNSIDALTKAFHHLRDTDPLILPRLLIEMTWLGAENLMELLESMLSSKVYFTRWSVLELLPQDVFDDDGKNKLSQKYDQYYQELREDSCKFIRCEANYKYQYWEFNKIACSLPKKERKKQRKKLEKEGELILSFSHLSLVFNNYLYYKSSSKYTVHELELFIDYLTFFRKNYQIGKEYLD